MRSVSVIVVGYNSRGLLDRALPSVESALEGAGIAAAAADLVVVDNGSVDGTAAAVRAGHPRWRVLESEDNVGFARGANQGARESAGEFLLLLNPDAWLERDCLERLLRAMEADPMLAWASPRLTYPDGRRQFVWEPSVGVLGELVRRLRNGFEGRRWVHGGLPRLLRALGDPGWLTAACALIRRSAWERVGGFDPGFFLYFEDVDLCVRLRQAGWRLALVEEALAVHDRHGLEPESESLVRYRESQLRYYRKHRPRWQSALLLRRLEARIEEVSDPAVRERLREVRDRARAALAAGVVDLDAGAARGARDPAAGAAGTAGLGGS